MALQGRTVRESGRGGVLLASWQYHMGSLLDIGGGGEDGVVVVVWGGVVAVLA